MTFELRQDFPRLGDLVQSESTITIGHCRKYGTVTGTAGQKLYIGDILVDNRDGSFTIPADIAAILAAEHLALYIGNDPVNTQMNTDPSYNPNITEFKTGALDQKIAVLWRGQIGVARGGVVGTSRGDSGIRFPVGTTPVQMKQVWDKLTVDNNMTILRQVP